MTLRDNEIIVIEHKHQNGITRVQGDYRPLTSVAGISTLPDQERRLLELLTNIGNNILNDGTNVILCTMSKIIPLIKKVTLRTLKI
jgi:hypothetical protein